MPILKYPDLQFCILGKIHRQDQGLIATSDNNHIKTCICHYILQSFLPTCGENEKASYLNRLRLTGRVPRTPAEEIREQLKVQPKNQLDHVHTILRLYPGPKVPLHGLVGFKVENKHILIYLYILQISIKLRLP